VAHHAPGDDEMFLANYADVLNDADLGRVTKELENNPHTIGAMLCVQPNYTFHLVRWANESTTAVTEILDVRRSETWINGGYFAFRLGIFDYINDGDELVVEPFQRLMEKNALAGVRHDGFWAPMDTMKEKLQLYRTHENGDRPSCVWEEGH
jgi:glucose-1-phosphate cytidylyltransferase